MKFGAVAQLGERLNGIQEVEGPIPFSSTLHTHVNFCTNIMAALRSWKNVDPYSENHPSLDHLTYSIPYTNNYIELHDKQYITMDIE